MAKVCSIENEGIGLICLDYNFVSIKKWVLATPDQSFTSQADFADPTKWDEGMIAGNLFPLPGFEGTEPQKVEDGEFVSSFGAKKKQYPGIKGYMAQFIVPPDVHKIMKSYNGKNWRLYEIDYIGTPKGVLTGGVIKGQKLTYFNVSDQDDPTGADAPAFTNVTIQKGNSSTEDDNYVYLKSPVFELTELVGVDTVTIAQDGAVSANAIVVDVTAPNTSVLNGQALGANFSSNINGLDVTNFRGTSAAGAILTPLSAVADLVFLNKYTVTFALFVAADTIEVIPTADNLHTSAKITAA